MSWQANLTRTLFLSSRFAAMVKRQTRRKWILSGARCDRHIAAYCQNLAISKDKNCGLVSKRKTGTDKMIFVSGAH
jgi:hypothetical protein